jgi:hypothetical protein
LDFAQRARRTVVGGMLAGSSSNGGNWGRRRNYGHTITPDARLYHRGDTSYTNVLFCDQSSSDTKRPCSPSARKSTAPIPPTPLGSGPASLRLMRGARRWSSLCPSNSNRGKAPCAQRLSLRPPSLRFSLHQRQIPPRRSQVVCRQHPAPTRLQRNHCAPHGRRGAAHWIEVWTAPRCWGRMAA